MKREDFMQWFIALVKQDMKNFEEDTMKDITLKITISGKLLERLGYEQRPKKKELRRVIKNSLVLVAGLRDGTWKLM